LKDRFQYKFVVLVEITQKELLSMTQWYPKIAEFDLRVGMQILISLENFTAFGAILM
jgi:hypothetical protein